MFQAGLVFSTAAALVATGAFAYVGYRQQARSHARGMRAAGGAFAVWWWGLATYAALVGVLLNLLAALGVHSVSVFIGVRALAVVTLCVALGGLVSYITFLYRGGRRTAIAGAVVGSTVYALLFAIVGSHRAVGVDVGTYQVTILFEPALGEAKTLALLAILAAPQIVAAIALLALYPRIKDPTPRWRILLVGSGILLWSTAAFLAGAWGDEVWVLLTRPVLGTIAALGALWAYEPPAWARARFGVSSL